MTVFGNASDWETPGFLVSELSHCFPDPGLSDQICSPSDTSKLSCSARSNLFQTLLISIITLKLGFTITPLPCVSSGILK